MTSPVCLSTCPVLFHCPLLDVCDKCDLKTSSRVAVVIIFVVIILSSSIKVLTVIIMLYIHYLIQPPNNSMATKRYPHFAGKESGSPEARKSINIIELK